MQKRYTEWAAIWLTCVKIALLWCWKIAASQRFGLKQSSGVILMIINHRKLIECHANLVLLFKSPSCLIELCFHGLDFCSGNVTYKYPYFYYTSHVWIWGYMLPCQDSMGPYFLIIQYTSNCECIICVLCYCNSKVCIQSVLKIWVYLRGSSYKSRDYHFFIFCMDIRNREIGNCKWESA